MSTSIPTLINHEVLLWARELLAFDVDHASDKIGITPNQLEEWEIGKSTPSMAQLRKISHTYGRPIAHFFLPTPPPDRIPKIKDHRLLPDIEMECYSPTLMKEFLNAVNRRETMIELCENVNEPLEQFSLSVSSVDKPTQVAEIIRTTLGLSYEEQISFFNERELFNFLRSKIEGAGILVFQVSGIELSEMRGYSFYYDIFPIIGINRKDPPTGRSFSLMHELTHIFLRETGVCDVTKNDQDRIEIFCNQVAAEALVPSMYLEQEEQVIASGFNKFDDNSIQLLATKYGVSREVVVRRLLTLDYVDDDFYRHKRRQYQNEFIRLPKKESKIFIMPAVDTISLSGRPYISMVMSNLSDNKISSSDASHYLGVKLKHLDKISETLMK